MTDDRTEFDRYKAFFCNDGLLAQYRQKTAEAMQAFESADYEMYRPYMIDAYFPYSTRSEAQKADFNIAMFAVAQNENNYQYVPEKLRTLNFTRQLSSSIQGLFQYSRPRLSNTPTIT